MLDDLVDVFRAQMTCAYLLILFPLALSVVVPKTGVVQEFKAFRLQHFDLAGNQKGSRLWKISFDATALGAQSLRRCLIVSWHRLAMLGETNGDGSIGNELKDILPHTLGSALIVIPKNLSDLGSKDRQLFLALEDRLLEKSWPFAVYFLSETPELLKLLTNIENQMQKEQGTAVAALMSTILADSYHFVSENQASSVALTSPMYNFVAKLSAFERSENVPTILVVAHYDSFGAIPALSFGADSNASGMTSALEILRLFKQLYDSSFSRARYNLIFLFSAAGKFNFMGVKQYVDDYLDKAENSNTPISKLDFAICLDSLLGDVDDKMFLHVSKTPKNGSSVDKFFYRLKKAAHKRQLSVEMNAKKINLADDLLAWEHERFTMRKLYGFTVSGMKNHKNQLRRSVLDLSTNTEKSIENLMKKTGSIAEALMNHVFQTPDDETVQMFDDIQVNKQFVRSTFIHLTNVSRAQQDFSWSLSMTNNNNNNNNGNGNGNQYQQKKSSLSSSLSSGYLSDSVLSDLFATVNHLAGEVQLIPVKVDKRDPEFVLYGATMDTLYAYRVKPAVFDLILAMFIAGYLSLIYIFVLNVTSFQNKLKFWTMLLKKHV